MEEVPKGPPRSATLRGRVERVLIAVTAAVALLGGLLLVAISLLSVYSIIGRALPDNTPLLGWWRSVRGTFEVVEMATALAIFAFLPYTHLSRGNVAVDFFTSGVSARARACLAVFANAIFAAIALLFTWRMIAGTEDILTARFTQTTMLLRIPVWVGHLPATILMGLLALVCLFTVWRSLDEVLGSVDSEPA